MLTLLESGGYRDMVLEAGADAFVGKPALVTELLPAIRLAARHARPQRALANAALSLSEAQLGK